MLPSRGRLLDSIGLLARLGLAAVWLVSGGLKVADPGQTYLAVQAYEVLPGGLVGVAASVLPLVEIVFGLLLLLGVLTRPTAVASAALLVIFIAAVAQSWARGLTIDCGCFGGGGQVEPGQTTYPEEIATDLGFLALAVWLIVRPGTFLSVDRWFGKHRAKIGTGERDDSREDVSGRSGADGEETPSAAVGGKE